MTEQELQTRDLLAAGRWQEVLRAGPAFRLVPTVGGRTLFQRYEGFFGSSGHIWRHIDIIDCPLWAADRLAVAEGRMTSDECAKRCLARKRAKKKAAIQSRAVA